MGQRELQRELLAVFTVASHSGREYVSGLFSRLANDLNWRLHLVAPEDFTAQRLRQRNGRPYDGIIVSMPGTPDAMKALARSDVPTVLVNIEDASLAAREHNVSAVWLDNGDIGRVGAEHLLAQGEFKSFAFIHKNTREFFSRERESSFRSTLAKRGIASSAFDPDTNDAKALAAWLKALPKPAAVMAATDERAVECLRACRAAKIEVPNQIAILGVGDDMSRSKLLPVPLSSVRPNYAQAGFLAMQELDRLYAMRGRRKYQEIVVPADGVSLRDSTKPALSASHLVKNALAFIEQNADRDLTPQMVTSHLGKSRRLVELRFGEICHTTVRMAIEDCRLAKACPRLRQTDGNVRQVAAELQFKSANALTRIFRRHFGKTITEWLTSEAGKSGRPSTAARQRRQAPGTRSDSQPTPRTA